METECHKQCEVVSPVAWPTIALLVACYGMWALAIAFGHSAVVPVWMGTVVASVAAFVSYTAMHESAHGNVGRARWLNELVGRLAALPLAAPFTPFRYLHLTHHQHTNHPEKDPDIWSGLGPRWLLPLRWVTQDIYYYIFWLRAWSRRPRCETFGALLNLALIVTLLVGLCAVGYGVEVLLFWIVPGRAAMFFLCYAFNYLPHRPHHVLASEDKYGATHIVGGPTLTIPMVCQNYHLVHHLDPRVPFYHYPRAWHAQKNELLAKGARVVALFGRQGLENGSEKSRIS